MNVKYTRERFNADRGVICIKEILYDGIILKFGDVFYINNPNTKTRARQLYNMRKLEHLDSFIKQYGESIVRKVRLMVLKNTGSRTPISKEVSKRITEILEASEIVKKVPKIKKSKGLKLKRSK